MHSEPQLADIHALFLAFCDESLAVWPKAARKLGQLAGDGQTHAFEQYAGCLLSDNIARRRHALCALAAHRSTTATPFETTTTQQAEEEMQGILLHLCSQYLRTHGTVQELHQLPNGDQLFESWHKNQLERLKKRLPKVNTEKERDGLLSAIEKYETIDASTKLSELPSFPLIGVKPKGPWEWELSSYLSGVTHTRTLCGLPPDLVVKTLCEQGRPSLAACIPQIFSLTQGNHHPGLQNAVVQLTCNGWRDEPYHYIRYLQQLAETGVEFDFIGTWTRQFPIHDSLKNELSALFTSKQPDSKEILRLTRSLIEQLPTDDWQWAEAHMEKQNQLAVLGLLLLYPVAENAPTWPLGSKTRSKTLPHRIALIQTAIERCHRAQKRVLRDLIRYLKELLHQELRTHRKNTLAIASTQLLRVQNLIEEWNLPGTSTKDLATIACRALMVARQENAEGFFKLFYLVFYALPEQRLLTTMIRFCPDASLKELLQHTVKLLQLTENNMHHPQQTDETELLQTYQQYVHHFDSLHPKNPSPVGENMAALIRFFTRQSPGFTGNADSVSESLDFDQHLKPLVEDWLRIKYNSQAERAELIATGRVLAPATASKKSQHERDKSEYQARVLFEATSKNTQQLAKVIRNRKGHEDALEDAGKQANGSRLLFAVRGLVEQLELLREYCSATFPYLEKRIVIGLLVKRLTELRQFDQKLSKVFEDESEEQAAQILFAKNGTHIEASNHSVKRMVHQWMLDRYMLRELVQGHRLPVFNALSTLWVVLVWIAIPFGLCVLITQMGHMESWAGIERWAGLPFAVWCALHIIVLILIGVETRHLRSKKFSVGHMFLPKILGALFLGVQNVISSDENWTMSFLEYPWLRILTMVLFLVGAFYFTRELVLPGTAPSKQRLPRTLSIMAVGLWQSFALVLLFGVFGGLVMGGPGRAGLEISQIHGIGQWLGEWLPNEVGLGPWFFQPTEQGVSQLVHGEYRIFPWMILSWTVEVFFFSAIIERVLGGGKE